MTSLIVAIALAAPAAAGPVGICPWQGESNSLVIYDRSLVEGWARVRCTAAPAPGNADPDGFCLDWTRCQSAPGPDGLVYLAFVVRGDEQGGFLRFNPGPYQAVVTVHAGSGGTTWFESLRDVPGDTTDWRDLQDRGYRVIGMRWLDTGIAYASVGGRFTRPGAAGSSLLETSERASRLSEWVHENLDPDDLPYAVTGSSGGGDFTLATMVTSSALIDVIDYLGYVSGAPFADFQKACAGTTTAGTYVDQDTGELGAARPNAFGNPPDFGNNPVVADFPDGLWVNTECRQRAVSDATAAASSTLRMLDQALAGRGRGYPGILHTYVATGAANNDAGSGIVWSAGQIHAHPFFAPATRIWDRCVNEEHGSPLRQPDRPCFTRIHDQLLALLGRPLLRNDDVTDLEPVTPPLRDLLPLSPRDALGNYPPGGADPDATILGDGGRPLVFYGLDGTGTLYLVKTADGRIGFEY